MSELLGFVPAFVSLVLGIVYLTTGDGSTGMKVAGVVVFGVGVALQFYFGQMVAGVLILVVLAVALEFWRRMNT